MKARSRQICLVPIGTAALLLVVLSAGCAGDKPGPQVAAQAGGSGRKPNAEVAAANPQARKSVFTLDGSSRDPFFPQAKKPQETAAPAAAVQSAPPDIAALLSAGLQGIGGTTDRRIAVINNVILEPGRQTEIPVRVNKQESRLSVKCREITMNTVALDVEGYGRVVVKAKSAL